VADREQKPLAKEIEKTRRELEELQKRIHAKATVKKGDEGRASARRTESKKA
jgi:hypothetical protein